jgi:hypothetical protein
MNKSFWGSINVTELVNAFNGKHSAFVKAGEKKQYFGNVTLWENDEPDKFGNTHSLVLNPVKDSGDAKIYICNFKPNIKAINNTDSIVLRESDVDDIPLGNEEMPF